MKESWKKNDSPLRSARQTSGRRTEIEGSFPVHFFLSLIRVTKAVYHHQMDDSKVSCFILPQFIIREQHGTGDQGIEIQVKQTTGSQDTSVATNFETDQADIHKKKENEHKHKQRRETVK